MPRLQTYTCGNQSFVEENGRMCNTQGHPQFFLICFLSWCVIVTGIASVTPSVYLSGTNSHLLQFQTHTHTTAKQRILTFQYQEALNKHPTQPKIEFLPNNTWNHSRNRVTACVCVYACNKYIIQHLVRRVLIDSSLSLCLQLSPQFTTLT